MMDHRFPRPLAEVRDQARLAEGPPRQADVAPVQDQPVVGMALVFRRHHAVELGLDLQRRLAGCHAGPIADAEDVGVDRDGGLTEGDVEHDIRGLATDAGQRFQRLTRVRDLAPMLVRDFLRQGDEILRLGAEEADGLDQALQALLAEGSHLFRCVGGGEQRGRRLVDAGVGGLRRKHHRDQQRERVDVLKLAFGRGASGLKTAERFLDLGGCPLRQRARRGRVVGGRTLGRTFDFSRRAGAGLTQALRRSPRRLAGDSAGHPASHPARCLASHSSGIVSSMVPDNDPTQEPTIFSAVLTPHRSLSRKGFLALMLVAGGASLVMGTTFLLAGAWPVFGFCGLDVLLLYLAFKVSYRRAKAYEQVTVTPSELTVRQVSHRGRISEWTLNPLWVRIDRVVHAEFGIERLFLVSHGRRLAIAGCLGPQEKESFALALSAALGEAKRGPTRTVFD